MSWSRSLQAQLMKKLLQQLPEDALVATIDKLLAKRLTPYSAAQNILKQVTL